MRAAAVAMPEPLANMTMVGYLLSVGRCDSFKLGRSAAVANFTPLAKSAILH